MTQDRLSFGIDRRDLIAAGLGAAALTAGLSVAQAQQTQAPPSPTAPGSAAAAGKVTVERRGEILLIGIDRPQAQNLLDAPVLLGLGKAYYQLDHDDGLRVAVLHGIGPDFSLGVDLASLAAAQAAGTFPPKDPDFINSFGLRPPYRTKPVVVAVQGGVKFGAHELFLAADIRVASADTKFSQGEVTRGVFPGGGATVRLPREIGWSNAMRYMLTGEEWGADEAHRLGTVQEVTPAGKQVDRALEIAQKVAAAAPLSVRATLAAAHQPLSGDDALFQPLTAELLRLNQSEDRKEFLRASREGRAPVFRGI
jgi:enoyl-CoA hydratase/carnithine racemase